MYHDGQSVPNYVNKADGNPKNFEAKTHALPTVQTNAETKEIEANSDRATYNFILSEFGDSWHIGIGITNGANAFKNGVSACPENLTIPRILTDEIEGEKKVTVIGKNAFLNCGSEHGKTRRLILTRNVKVIKEAGLGNMGYLESFTIEEGSVLERIEKDGLSSIGFNTGRNDPTKRGILILPSSLSSVADYGIHACNLFKLIVYCGSHPLTNTCELELGVGEKNKTVVNVTRQYPADTSLFGRNPDRSSEVEEAAEDQCNALDYNTYPFTDFEICAPFLTSTRHLLTIFSPLLSSYSITSFSVTRFFLSLYFPL